eukprot:SAG31_NODE_3672_length_4001_cov_3.839313_2_plen_304_part_00
MLPGAQLQGEISFAQIAAGGAARPQHPNTGMHTPPRRRPSTQRAPNTAPAANGRSRSTLGATASRQAEAAPQTPTRDTRMPPRSPMSADRFVPTRSAMDFDLSYHQLTNENLASNSLLEDDYSSGVEYKSILSKMLFEGADRKILRFAEPSPLRNPSNSPHSKRALQAVGSCDQAELRQIYHENKAHSPYSRLQHRQISHTPEKILDAPDLLDDYYLNLLDWSSKDVLAVALGQTVYLWNAKTGVSSKSLHSLRLCALTASICLCLRTWVFRSDQPADTDSGRRGLCRFIELQCRWKSHRSGH